MHNGIKAHGRHIYVHAGYSNTPYVNMSNPSAGMVRYNGSSFEVYDGSSWMTIIGAIPEIGINFQAESAIDWAIKRMNEEREWEQSDHPAIIAAKENLHKARQQLEVTAILVKQEEIQYQPV